MRMLSDAEAAEIERSLPYRDAKGKCPACKGTGSYLWKGEEVECELDESDRHVQFERMRHYALANITVEHAALDWADFPHADMRKRIDTYIENFENIRTRGLGIEFIGKHGIGKTWAAVYILKELVKQGYTGYLIQFTTLKGLWDNPDRDRLVERVREAQILVIDDILKPYGEGNMKAFYEEKLEGILRERTMFNRPTITTTNMTEHELERFYPRVYTILAGKQMPLILNDTGDHRRRVRENWEENVQEILDNKEPLLLW